MPFKHYAEGGQTLGSAIGYPGFPKPNPNPKEMAEGGEVEDSDHESMLDQCADECMSAIKSGDKAAFRDSFHVLVADILSKLSTDMDEGE